MYEEFTCRLIVHFVMNEKILVPMTIYKSNPETIAPMDFARDTYVGKLVKHDLMPIYVSSVESEEMVWENV